MIKPIRTSQAKYKDLGSSYSNTQNTLNKFYLNSRILALSKKLIKVNVLPAIYLVHNELISAFSLKYKRHTVSWT